MGLPIGGGTDATRVMSYNPFVALQWMLDGRTVAGAPTRDRAEIPTREEALRIYTEGSAWFSHEERERGRLQPGHKADLAVLTGDYMSVPVDEIGGLQSVLTMVGGRVVYAAEPFAALDPEHRP
jgi:predicted amidohydrolase YtcJ